MSRIHRFIDRARRIDTEGVISPPRPCHRYVKESGRFGGHSDIVLWGSLRSSDPVRQGCLPVRIRY